MSLSFEILCVTMNQTDFSKIQSMNIHSDVVFANQTDKTAFDQILFDGKHSAKMISTQTRGVGINRNLSLVYSSADICLLADDDIVYRDDVEQVVLNEFEKHPDADVFLFNYNAVDAGKRKIKIFKKTKKSSKIFRKMGGGIRIAFRLASVKKANLWFTTLFGGGCIFPCGEDSKWLVDAYSKGLSVYASKETIGNVSFEKSSWYQGVNERYFYGFGAHFKDAHAKTYPLWMFIFAIRTSKMTKMKFFDKIRWMRNGVKGYENLLSYENFIMSKSILH